MAMSLGTARLRSFVHSASPSSTPASHHPLLLCFRRKVYSMELLHDSGSPPTMTISYLDKLNPQQRRAVEHGGSALAETGPLLIIAGAGSGKTNTLAHRVAHLIVNGADPRRMMLLTFSRRAAAEMMRRVERIVANVMHERAEAMTDAIVWAGTFHAVGARLLREYADAIGLDRAFTIHDREDSADLMNLVRHDLGSPRRRSAFPRRAAALRFTRARSIPNLR